jgi:hypothetical protein
MGKPKPIKPVAIKEQIDLERQAEIDAVIAEFGGDTDAATALTGMAQALTLPAAACRRRRDDSAGQAVHRHGAGVLLEARSAEAMAAALISG